MNDDHSGPTPFDRLPRESEPPAALEAAIFSELRSRGLLGRRRRPAWIAPLAAALVGVAFGFLVAGGRVGSPEAAPADDRPIFMYLFSGGPQSGDGLLRTIEANREWARGGLAGRFVGGQKLLAAGTRLAPGGEAVELAAPRSDDATPTGYFLVRARDFDEALEVARHCPVLAMGVSVTVRGVDDLRWSLRTATLRAPAAEAPERTASAGFRVPPHGDRRRLAG